MEMTINCIGLACPIPVVKAKKAIEEFTEDGTLTVIADNETCVKNLTKLAGSMNLQVSHEKISDREYHVKIEVKTGIGAEEISGEDVPVSCAPVNNTTAVVISSEKMGEGGEALGKALMKAFIFALTNSAVVPETILFYNSGAYLTCEGSDSLEDLKALEEAGAKIYTCGTCLNFYGITEKLAVGSVTNMYDIVEMQMSAGKIIRP